MSRTTTSYEVSKASPRHEREVNTVARASPFTRDFANPPLSLKAMRAEAFSAGQVLVCTKTTRDAKGLVTSSDVVGFIWCRPMKPKHMPFSTVYYMGLLPLHQRGGLARWLLREALNAAKEGRIELVCENRNEPAAKFYKGMGGAAVATGTVGKDNRPYTRWRFEA